MASNFTSGTNVPGGNESRRYIQGIIHFRGKRHNANTMAYRTNYKICKLCARPIFRNEVELTRKWGRGEMVVGRFHKHCAYQFINKATNKAQTGKQSDKVAQKSGAKGRQLTK